MTLLVVGIDAGVGEGRTGFAVATRTRSGWVLLESWRTSLENAAGLVRALTPIAVAIDSPLAHATTGAWRRVDLLGRRLGLRLLPPSWRGMRRLVEEVRRLILPLGLTLLETHPSSAVRISGCRGSRELLRACFDALLAEPRSRDEEDAAIAACVARLFVDGRVARIEASDGSIWLPEPTLC